MNFLFTIAVGVTAAAPTDLDVFFSSDVVRPAVQRDDVYTAHVEPRLGVPTVLWALQVGPDAPAWTRAELTAAEAARRHLLGVANSFKLSGEAVARLDHLHTLDLGHGAIVVTFGRSFDAVPLFRDELHVVMTQARELVAITGNVNPATPKDRAFRLTGATAVASAAHELGLSVGAISLEKERDGWQRVTDSSGLVKARARRVWYGLPDSLEPAWHVELDDGDDAFFEVVSAWDGRLLSRKNLTVDATWRVYAETAAPFAPADSPHGTGYTPHPTGVRLPPIEGDWVSSSLVTLDFAPGARMDPWLPANATTLQGNNAFAFVDLFAPFGVNSDGGLPDGGTRPQDQLTPMTAPGVFDHAYDPDAGPTAGAQANAANTHLFYTVNWLHDWLLAAGFDEAAGNGQQDNLGRGGKANDRLQLAAFSYARPNNASMATFADGEASRMQMGNFAAFQVSYLDLSVLDAGRQSVNATGPNRVSLTAPIAVMQSDAGANGCAELFDPSALEGRIAVAYAQGCSVRDSFNRALDAGAAALIVVSPNNGFPILTIPDASIPVPLVGVTAAQGPFLAALDAGVTFSPTIFQYPMPARPSALDTQVVTHEFGHFLSNRLISDTAGLQLQISRSMGEGWSDFLALLQTVRARDATLNSNQNWSGVFAVGGYVVGGPDTRGASLEHHWSGIRRYPYTVDTEKNGLSFRHIRDGAALPTGIVGTSQPNSEVHAAGEVWCTMLWEGFVSHLRATPDFERARTQMLETLVAALKATPANPDFLEARDAMLAVAFAADPAFFRTLYSGFAKRGAGPRAEAPSKLATNNAPVIEDTSMGDTVKITAAGVDDSLVWCDRDGRLDLGESGLLQLTARNVGFSAISAPQTLKVRALSQGVTVLGDGLVTFAPSAPFSVVRASTPVRLDTAADVRILEFRIETVGQTPATTSLVSVLANADLVPSATEDFEGPFALDRGTGWRRGDELEANNYLVEEKWNISPQTPTQTVMNGPNATSRGRSWLTTPALQLGADPVTVRFKHRYQFESTGMTQWDGAYVEVSEDGQQSWAQVTSLAPGYSGTISTTTTTGAPSTNPSAGQAAWVGRSNGYPSFLSQNLNLGTRYANKTIHLRFVIATDANGGGSGWELDDVEVLGLATTPFTQRVADRQQCVNRPPNLEAGPPRDIAEKQQVTLMASVMDPDGDPVTVTWAQVGGPSVSLSGDTFTAPDVTQDTALEFEVTAKDAALESKDRLTLTVKAVNSPPQVMASGPNLVRSGQQFVLTATGIDADGDTLETTFVQTRGPLAKDLGGGKFQAPPVKDPDRMYFDVIVSDGQARAIFPLEVGLEPSACGCTATPLNVFGFALAALLLRRRKR